MTLKTLITTVVAGLMLTVGVQSAWAGGMSDASDRAQRDDELSTTVDARKEKEALADYYKLVFSTIEARQQALGRDFALGDFAVNNTWQTGTSSSPAYGDASDRAAVSDLYATSVADSHERVDLGNQPVATPTVSSGSEIAWPELGLGFGFGMVLLLGLILTVRYSRSHPVAHG
jgi:hypothetical protein